MPYPKNKDFKALLGKVNHALAQKLPVCLYRKPNQPEVKAIFQESSELLLSPNFEDSGFIFAPFDLDESAVVLRPDKVQNASYDIMPNQLKSIPFESTQIEKQMHLDLVQNGLNAITRETLQKVVLSKKMEIEHQVSPEKLIVRLLDTYPSAFCYLFYHPQIGLWCGATPEVFIEIENNTLKTMSLAGTIPYHSNSTPKWGQKEKDEQQMVTDFITNRLSTKLDDFKIKGPESVRAGSLWHLKTEITAKLESNSSLKSIIELLHPTPAVCGLPLQEAKAFILENEDYHRTYYTGFLGELRMGDSQNTSLYVNLRCMELTQNTASVFVGGGITADSIPEDEWNEIQNKSKTMSRLL